MPKTRELAVIGNLHEPADPEGELVTAVTSELRSARDWPYPLHSPLAPSSLDGDGPAGFGQRDLPARCTVALTALAAAARSAKGTDRKVGLPTSEVLHGIQEWYDRRPAFTAARGQVRHRAVVRAICEMDEDAWLRLDDQVPDWLAALDKKSERAGALGDRIKADEKAARAVEPSDPQTAKKLGRAVQRLRLNQLSARVFSTDGAALALAAAGGAQPITSMAEREQVAAVLQQPAGAARLMARVLLKSVRAHLGRPAADAPADEHSLVVCALGLLPSVVVHGEAHYRLAAATVLRGLPPRALPLDDTGLPRCFQAQTLQSPADLAAQARFALGSTGPQPAGAQPEPVLEMLNHVLALARDLARIATDPMRAHSLGFTADDFAQWARSLEDDLRPARLPARLTKAGDETTAAYLALDLLPRLHRWKDQHSAMAGPPQPGGNAAKALGTGDGTAILGFAEALRLAQGETHYAPALPLVHLQYGSPK